MKSKLHLLGGALLLLSTISHPLAIGHAQGTAFTYQGRLNSGGGLASGNYDLAFTVFDTNAPSGILIAGPITNSPVAVSNGLFTVTLDFGAGVFTGPDRWLEMAVRTNGAVNFTTLAPRQPITPTPYAIMANSASNLLGTLPASKLTGTIPAANVSGTYGNAVNFNNGADSFSGTFYGQFFGSSFTGGIFTGQFLGDGSGLANLNASQLTSGTVPNARLAGNVAFVNSNQTFTAQNNFSQPVGFGNPAPVYPVDVLGAFAVGRFISTNAYFGSVIVLQNQMTNLPSYFLGAVNFNNALNNTPGQIAYVANNPTNQNYDTMQFRVGAFNGALTLQADPRGAGVSSLIGGTTWNTVDASSGGNVIAGGGYPGFGNLVYSNSFGVFIGAGSGNHIGPSVNDSSILGGSGNTISAYDAVIGGGQNNAIQYNATYATISGGVLNLIQTNVFEATIAGGNRNTNGAYRSVIGGGIYNFIQLGAVESVIGGGDQNLISIASYLSVIGGGYHNTIQSNDQAVVIGGGFNNTVQSNNWISTISGGQNNTIKTNGTGSVIAGGFINTIGSSANSPSTIFGATIGGGYINNIGDLSSSATISGGNFNTIQTNSAGTVISGGSLNIIQDNASGDVIGGGFGNTNGGINSVIGGGVNNQIQANASSAVIPGGFKNAAGGNYSFAAGSYAHATNDGTFVWADSSSTNAFGSTSTNQFLVRATGGVQFTTAGAGLTIDGQPILAGNNGSGLVGVNAATLVGLLPSAFAPSSGSTSYIQNQNGSPQAASFNINGPATAASLAATSLVVSNAQVTGLLRLGSETGTSETPSPAGLVIRRINSTSTVSNTVVAISRTTGNVANLTLVRDGTIGGFQIQYPALPGNVTIACMGMDSSGVQRNFYTNLANPAVAGTVQIYASALNVVHFECTFGVTYAGGNHLTQVTLSRYAADNFWSGNVISTYNQ